MNIITADAAFSIFPYPTFVKRKSYISKNRPESAERSALWARKYEQRGFSLIARDTLDACDDLYIGPRRVLDGRTWIIPFAGKLCHISNGQTLSHFL